MVKKLNQKKMIRTYPNVYSRGQRDASTGWMERRGEGGECFKFSTRVGWMSRIFLLDDCDTCGNALLAGWRPRFFLLDVHMRKLQ